MILEDNDYYDNQTKAAGQHRELAQNSPELTFGLLLGPFPQRSTLFPAFFSDLWLA